MPYPPQAPGRSPLARRIAAWRARHGLSIACAAALLGVLPRSITRWSIGAHEPADPGAVLARLAELDANPSLIGPPRGKPGRPRNVQVHA